LRRISHENSSPSLIFVHRDADSDSDANRREQILSAASKVSLVAPVVPVVPIQELEAWLLLDEAAIRAAVGRPSGHEALDLPAGRSIEAMKSPKEILREACVVASRTKGRRRDSELRKFSARRRTLLERLDIDGPVRQLTAWQRLEQDIALAVTQLLRSA
jgi:hypothetical protein